MTVSVLTAGMAQAANIWDGGGADGNWTTVGNWDNNLNPAAYAAVTFNTAGAGQTNTFLGGGRFLNQLIFNANANNNIGIELATTAGGTGAANLYLYGTDAGGAPKITVDSGAAANIRIFGGPSASVVGLGVRAGNTASGDLTIDHNGSGNLSIEKGITGAGYSVAKTGTGTLTLSNSGNASTYNNFTLNDGRVRIGGTRVATALGTNTVYLNGGTLSSDSGTARSTAQALVFGGNVRLGHATDNGTLTLDGTTDLGGATRTITTDSAVTMGGVISNGGLTKDGTGTMTLTNANTYAGATTVKTGVLNIRNASALGTTTGGTVVSNGGSLQLQGSMIVAENINIAGAGATGSAGALRNVTGGNNTISGLVTLDANATIGGGSTLKLTGGVANNYVLSLSGGVALEVDSAITGSGGLTKTATSSADLTLKGLNTYTGNTTINLGNLLLADNAGLTFVIGASGVNNALTGAGTAILDGDFYFDLTSAGTTAGDLWTIASVTNQTFASTFKVDGFTDAGSDKWTKAITGSTYYEFSEATGKLTVIPEPATIGMLGLGAIITLLLRRMRTC